MSSAAADMTDAEVRELNARLRARDRVIDAGLPPDRPRGDGARRRPLGLAPAPGPDDDASPRDRAPSGPRFSLRDGKSEEHLAHPVAAGFVYDIVDMTTI
jgi:hypothetical protein